MKNKKKYKADIDPKDIESIRKFFKEHYDYTSFELRHKYDIPISTLNYWRRKAGIPNKKPDAFKNYRKDPIKVEKIEDPKVWDNGPWFMEMYIKRKIGAYILARMINRSVTIVYRRLKRFNIPIREHREAVVSTNEYKNEEWLWNEYVRKNRTLKDISEEAGVNRYTICHWLAEFCIAIKENASHTIIKTRYKRIEEYRNRINGTGISTTKNRTVK